MKQNRLSNFILTAENFSVILRQTTTLDQQLCAWRLSSRSALLLRRPTIPSCAVRGQGANLKPPCFHTRTPETQSTTNSFKICFSTTKKKKKKNEITKQELHPLILNFRKLLYQVPTAVLLNYDKLSGLKNNTNVSSYSSGSYQSKITLSRLNSRCWQVCIPLWRLYRRIGFSCLFQLLEVACIPWAHGSLPFSEPPIACQVFLPLHHSDPDSSPSFFHF